MTDDVVTFLKLGGSLITDKTSVESVRSDVLARVAREVQSALLERPDLKLVVGHGSGSFGHVAAAKFGTREGVKSREEWYGFSAVSDSAARLNALVRQSFIEAGLATVSLQPSASVLCHDGKILSMATEPIVLAMKAGLVPLVYGDVAFDDSQGGAIISTEEILTYLAPILRPSWLLLAGETRGVLDRDGELVSFINRKNIDQVRDGLTGSRGTDVTGGMQSKVMAMLDLVSDRREISVRIFSGLEEGLVRRALLQEPDVSGTVIKA
jgi:isopentenyl phosphate kinase